MRRIAFFGGSFDPPHCGHLAIAKAAADRFALDEVLFAPVGKQPLKETAPGAAFVHRYAMTALATQTDKRFSPSLLDTPLENESMPRPNYTPPNYTVDTLARLRRSLEAASQPFVLYTLLGADSWLGIARWRDALRLLSLSDWIVASRPGFSLANAERALPAGVVAQPDRDSQGDLLVLRFPSGSTTRVHLLNDLEEDVSATALRQSFQIGEAPPILLSAAVLDYIHKTDLYRAH